MYPPSDSADDMARNIEERRELLRRFIQERKLKIKQWAEAADVLPNSIYNFLNGHSKSLDAETYIKLAKAAKVPVWRINGEEPEAPSATSIWVVGYVEAGSFREALEWDRADWYSIDVPIPERFRNRSKALEIRGPSMDLEYPSGSVVLWVDVLESRDPRDGDHVVVYQHCKDGAIEATVKELRTVDGHKWLWPRSSSPEHQQPIDMEELAAHVTHVEIRGIVTGSYRARPI